MTQTPENQQQYGSILTILGENAEQNGKLQNKQISFTHIAIGDANDTYVQPDRGQSALVNELHRIPVNSVDVLQPTSDSVPMLKVEAILPDNVNDLIIREFAAVAEFNGQTYFHAVGNCARIYVPPPINNGNVVTPVTLEMIFVITSAEPIIEIDPNVVTASREWVSKQIPQEKYPVIGEAARSSTERFEEKCNAKDFLIPAATPADAIQLAFDKASIKNYPRDDTGGHTYTSAYKEVLIPAGEWIISKKINLPAYWSVDARGAFLKPADGFTDFMFEGDGWQARWKGGVIASNPENGEYSGKGIKINNKNKDQGNVKIKDVQFKGLYAGSDVECQSTKFVFEDCSWDNCKHFVIQRKCDVVEIRGGWGTQGNLDVDGSGSFEVKAGTLLFNNFLGVPRPASGKETAWINFAGSRLVVQGNSRFGGEGGSKTLVNWRTKYDETYTYFPVGMTIKNNHLFMVDGGSGDETKSPSCVVRLFEVPNHIHINNNAGMVDTRYMIAWARSVDTSAQRADLLAKMERDLWEENVAINLDVRSKLFDFDVTGNQGHFASMVNDWSYIEHSELFHDVFNGIPVQKPLYDKATFYNPSGKKFTKCDYVLDSGYLVLKLPAKWTSDANGYQVVIDTRPNIEGNVNYRYAQKAYCSIYTGYDGSGVKSRVMTDNRLPVGIPPGFQTPAISSIEAGYWTRDGGYSFGQDFDPGIGDKCLAVRIPVNTGYDVSDLTFVSVRAM